MAPSSKMRDRLRGAWLAALLLIAVRVFAQPGPARPLADPESGQSYREVRPSGDLERGAIAAPTWFIAAAGLAVGAVGTFVALRRARKRGRR